MFSWNYLSIFRRKFVNHIQFKRIGKFHIFKNCNNLKVSLLTGFKFLANVHMAKYKINHSIWWENSLYFIEFWVLSNKLFKIIRSKPSSAECPAHEHFEFIYHLWRIRFFASFSLLSADWSEVRISQLLMASIGNSIFCICRFSILTFWHHLTCSICRIDSMTVEDEIWSVKSAILNL